LLARVAIEKIASCLPVAVEKPGDIEPRYWLLYASMIAGIGIDHGVTHYGHLIEHMLTGYNPELPHGAGLGMVHRKLIGIIYRHDPATMAYILQPLDPSLKPVSSDWEKAVKAYESFLERIGFKERLSDYGFSEDSIREVLELYDKLFEVRYGELAPFQLARSEVHEILREIL